MAKTIKKNNLLSIFDKVASEYGCTDVLGFVETLDFFDRLHFIDEENDDCPKIAQYAFRYLIYTDVIDKVFEDHKRMTSQETWMPILSVTKNQLQHVIRALPGRASLGEELEAYIRRLPQKEFNRFMKFIYFWAKAIVTSLHEQEDIERNNEGLQPIVIKQLSHYVKPSDDHVEMIDFLTDIWESCFTQQMKNPVYVEFVEFVTHEPKSRKELILDEYMFFIDFVKDFKNIAALKKIDLDSDDYVHFPWLMTEFVEYIQTR